MRRLRVLHIVLDLQAGGLERMVADLVRRIDPARFEPHVLALRFLGRHAVGLEAFATLHAAPSQSRGSLLWPRALTRVIREIGPDIVHTHSGVWYKASLAARLAGVPYMVHTDHGRHWPDPWLARRMDECASRRTDRVVAVSQALAGQLVRTVLGNARPILVIPNGVDTEIFQPTSPTEGLLGELGIPLGALVLGSLGRFDRIKGYDVVLDGFARFLARWTGPETVLVLAGEGPEEASLQTQAAALGISQQVRFVGWRTDTPALYNAFTVFTLGSRSEGTSLSLLEAMSCGTCPVVTNVGGNAAVLGPGLAHRLAPPEDPAALAAAWRMALEDSVAREADRQTARGRVSSEWSLGGMVRRYEDLYGEFSGR